MAGRAGNMTTARSWSPSGVGVTPETTALWFLVALELLAQVGLRHYYRRHHGG